MLARPSSPPAISPATARGGPATMRPPPMTSRKATNTSDAVTSNRRRSLTSTHLLHHHSHDAIAPRQNPEQQPHQQEPGRCVKGPVGEVAETQPNQHRSGELEADAGREAQRRPHAGV